MEVVTAIFASNNTVGNQSSDLNSTPKCQDAAVYSNEYRQYRITIEVFVVAAVCTVGFVGNALSITVLRRDTDRKYATNWLLRTLAVVDTMYLVLCLFMHCVYSIYNFTDWFPILDTTFPYFYPWVWFLGSWAQTLTVWLVLLLTIDRYMAICRPHNHQVRSETLAKRAVALLVVIAFVYNLPRIFERKTVEEVDPSTGEIRVCTTKTWLRESKAYFAIYKTAMYILFRSVGPLLLLIFLNVRLTQALMVFHRNIKRLRSKHPKRRTENLTAILVAVVSVFIVCELPDTSLRIVLALHDYKVLSVSVETLRWVNVITNLLLTVNSAINFLIYCLIGKKFRRILTSMIYCAEADSPDCNEVSESEGLMFRLKTKTNGGRSANDPSHTLATLQQTNGNTTKRHEVTSARKAPTGGAVTTTTVVEINNSKLSSRV